MEATMQTVPSLIGTGTAIAAAASGLVFGQPTTEPNTFSPSTRRPSHSRRVSIDREPGAQSPSLSNFASSRPATSNAAAVFGASHHYTLPRPVTASRPPLSRYQRPPMPQTQSTPPQLNSRQSSLVRHSESPAPIPESRDSISSNGSWIRRFSVRPLSRHESTRSSVGPDAPSIFSHGSAAPILRGSPAATLPPNKLVKRSTNQIDPDPLPRRRRAKSHLQILPTLRRPATSHQRSATLQQFRPDSPAVFTPTDSNNVSFDDQARPHEFLDPTSTRPPTRSTSLRSGWKSYFHSKRFSISGRTGLSRLGESSPHARGVSLKRICTDINERGRVYLVKPRMVSAVPAPQGLLPAAPIQPETRPPQTVEDKPTQSPETSPFSTPRNSVSMPFASGETWAVRGTGSTQRSKRSAESRSGNKRRVSEPLTGAQSGAVPRTNPDLELTLPATSTISDRQGLSLGSAANMQLRSRKRNSSSPVPPPPRLANFHMDTSRLGYSVGVSTHQYRPNQPSGSSTSSTAMSQLRGPHHDRASTMESSEGDTRDCTSVDDDDTEYKSDCVFDSLRTIGSGRARAVETPLESVYDESPPSTAGNGTKTKRLSIHEMLGRTWDEDDKIMEEDENASTPIRTLNRSDISPHFRLESRFNSSPYDIPASATKEYSRLSFDDEFDDDWARDDEFQCNPLSPPSKGSSLNSRGINPNVRLALANISGNGIADTNGHDAHNDRPLSSLFDWSEPPTHEKSDTGRLPRPMTSYAKQMDPRGGRSANRRGPAPAHVRSQSVPVVHDAPEASKPTGAKYGTWGMATKPVSEDWDDDFEFGSSGVDNNDKDNKVFAVPESIRATQPSVKAHSGHIREFSLLVNDLKRLCRHARDMDMLEGSQKHLWKEADGIIALASPDEESFDDDDDQKSTSSINFDAFDIDERFGDDGFDDHSMNRLDAAFDGREPPMSKTTVVRERHSPRRRSVFSPEDDIFGNWPITETPPSNRPSRPRTPENKYNKASDVSGVVRSVIGAMQHRVPEQVPDKGKVHFDTNSLKALVKRAGDLRDTLSDIIRQADQITDSPMRTPRNIRQQESSPAFTRVFDDPGSSPPRRVARSRGSNSLREAASSDNSPPSSLPQRMQMMTVN
ncbi:hypothetical protein FGRA07_07224 [Fusarium graminearum]|nr:hypothetical protein FGRA07_07224 [Fusarium graminearum]